MRREKYLFPGLVFLVGLAVLDQSVRLAGDHLIRSGRWRDRITAPVALNADWDALVLGNCRALTVDSSVLERKLGTRISVAGSLAESLGSLAFNAMTALEGNRGRRLLIVLDDWILKTTLEEARPEIERRLLWWHLLSKEDREYFETRFDLGLSNRLGKWSGLWKYQGRGFTLVKSWVLEAPPESTAPASPSHESAVRPLDVRRYESQRETRFVVSKFALSVLEDIVDKAKEKGVRVAFVVSPLHYIRNSDAVNNAISDAAAKLAAKKNIPILDYLGNSTRWARRDDWWVDPGHLNPVGARDFTVALAGDLGRVWR